MWTEGSHEQQLAAAIAVACRRLHARGLIAGSEGNLSVRCDAETVMVSASAVDKATMAPHQVVRVRLHGPPDGQPVQGMPGLRSSSEFGMHQAIYAARPGVMAIVHAHPPVATGFAAAGQSIPENVLPEVPVVIGRMALVPYARPGTPALAEAMRPFLSAHDVFLLANHGVTAVGWSLEDAILRMESVEQAARIVLAARILGGVQSLPAEEVTALASLRRSSELH